MTSRVLEEALALAQFATIIPLHTIVEGTCTCGGKPSCKPGKHPRLNNWYTQATKAARKIDRWCKQWPVTNWGFALGSVSMLVCMDIDPRHGGYETLALLEAKYGPLPATVIVDTGGGGQHRYFLWPGRAFSWVDLGPGVHLLGDRRLAVAPGSRHISGRIYQWNPEANPDNTQVAKLPDWILDLIRKEATPRKSATYADKPTPTRRQAQYDADADLKAYMELVPELKFNGKDERRGRCPLHDDHDPSFTITRNPKTGKWTWRCFGNCEHSDRSRVKKSATTSYHYGDLKDLRTLLQRKEAQDRRADPAYYVGVRAVVQSKVPAGSDAAILADVILDVAVERGLDLRQPVGVSYREVARRAPVLGRLSAGNQLNDGGRRISRARGDLSAFGVHTQEMEPRHGQPRGTTSYDFSLLLAEARGEAPPDGAYVENGAYVVPTLGEGPPSEEPAAAERPRALPLREATRSAEEMIARGTCPLSMPEAEYTKRRQAFLRAQYETIKAESGGRHI